MYTLHDWNILQDAVRGLSQFDQRSLDAMRYLISGAIPSKIDTTNRVLIPKQLLSYAGLKKDVMINAFLNRIEIWDEKEYERNRKRNLEKNKTSAQKVLASINIPW
jgi:MraZ protein